MATTNIPTYAEALDAHYKNGPPADWSQRFISAYASMHPWEDFAETWGTYLDMVSEWTPPITTALAATAIRCMPMSMP